MNYQTYRAKNPLLNKEYSRELTDKQARLAYNAGANDGFNIAFWPALFIVTVLGVVIWFLI